MSGDPEVHPQPESYQRMHGTETRVVSNFSVQALRGEPLTLNPDLPLCSYADARKPWKRLPRDGTSNSTIPCRGAAISG